MATDPELAFMGVLDEHLSEFGPMNRGQAARAIDAAMRSALEGKLDAAAVGRGLGWALARAEGAEKVAKEQAAARKSREVGETVPEPAPEATNRSAPETVDVA